MFYNNVLLSGMPHAMSPRQRSDAVEQQMGENMERTQVGMSEHAAIRAKQRGVPPLIEQWLDEFGEANYDGHGAVTFYFSRRSVRAMERAFGRNPVRRMAEYLNTYKVESVMDGTIITVGRRTQRLWRR
jgi:hypothetical protein